MAKKIVVGSESWTGAQVEAYRKRWKNYELLAGTLQRVLDQAAKKYAPMAIVQTRPKSISSFAEKCQRKKAKYQDPVNQITDLCGARVIVHTADEVAAMSGFIKRYFEIDEENSVDVSERLKPAEFGYRSVHYIVSFKKPEAVPSGDVNVDVPALLSDDEAFPNRRAEVQVRTILEHAWADIVHDRAYKSSFRIPAKWEREFAGVAALLEGADKSFSRILEGLDVYASSYGAYMTPRQMRDEIALLEAVLKYDPGNAGLAGRIGKMAIILGDWPKAVEVLERFAASGNLPILRDLGVALCKMHKTRPRSREFKQGQEYLEMACRPPHEDVDALASLAGSLKGIDDKRVRALYRQAFRLDPTDPYPLENYLDLEIAEAGEPSIITLMTPVIDAAVQRCRAQADVGVNLPWAFYMTGKFFLLKGEPYRSLHAYAKAIELSPSCWMIESALASLERLNRVSGIFPGYEWVRRLLLLGMAVAAGGTARPDAEEAGEDRGLKSRAQKRKAKDSDDEAAEAGRALAEIRKLASPDCRPFKGPVTIMAGGCDPSVDKKMGAYRMLVLEGFRDFRGTLIGGGTKQGVSGLVGDIGREYPKAVHTVGYLPKFIPADATLDRRYGEIRKTDGSGFSPQEPLQNWIDILASGLRPSEVKVLGINGGPIAAVEYRIALALGATVGVLEESGREGTKLLRDEAWEDVKRLVLLPADPMTVRAFIGSGASRLEAGIRETLAREIHAAYRISEKERMETDDRAMRDWEKLPDDLKESNARQADHIFWKLRRIGCAWRKAPVRKIKVLKFTDEEVELMAEMEHGRWNAEKLLDGWVRGAKKDPLRKSHPCLVGWAALPEDVKDKDRETVRRIPAFLAKIGLEIRRLP